MSLLVLNIFVYNLLVVNWNNFTLASLTVWRTIMHTTTHIHTHIATEAHILTRVTTRALTPRHTWIVYTEREREGETSNRLDLTLKRWRWRLKKTLPRTNQTRTQQLPLHPTHESPTLTPHLLPLTHSPWQWKLTK